jgi:hypothetical protein
LKSLFEPILVCLTITFNQNDKFFTATEKNA